MDKDFIKLILFMIPLAIFAYCGEALMFYIKCKCVSSLIDEFKK